MARPKNSHLVSPNRKDQILDAAATLFATNGYYKTTTAMVAAEVGVTQPYVFHFFKSKEELYLAVLDRATGRLVEAFQGVEAPPEELAHRMGNAFNVLMETHRDEILLCMQSFTTPEADVRAHVRGQFERILELIVKRFENAGLPNPKLLANQFIAYGMIISLSEVLDLPELAILDSDDDSC
ncbi:TetR/AcrR family transcriptional regulator [Cohnella lubricantis]|uniref:TetR/AcrR family transcriptional regulator n=1 Tax=Cohnella lubricantis TaxID=2163172 RepID=A0A841T6Q3_9BACL|nr:TetR/AcrR family transcriptional regulator [Cohnella lubricantis]MBB6677014.1 TetR/AcrR family transcriptional regulator [Cohnella lubricantis]MBP2119321.1 AcrR family transcriptional regulator [Cohnella lubricantis]